MTRAATINASKPAVKDAIVAIKPSLKSDVLVHITGTVAVYLFDKGYKTTDVFFPSIVEDALAGYDDFVSQF